MRACFVPIALALTANAAQAQTENAPKFTLNGDEAPKSKPWTEPAAFTYTKDAGDKASVSIDVAGRVDWRLGSVAETTNTGFIRAVAHRNTDKGSQVESYAGEFGMHFEPNTVPKGSTAPADFARAWYFFNDLSLGYSYKTNFDDEKEGCDGIPRPASCTRSHEGSARLKWTVQPFQAALETVPAFMDGKPTDDSPALAYSFGPTLTLFSDQVVHAKVDAGGAKPKGNVTGASAGLALAVSPRLFAYRLILRGSVQQTEALERGDRRRAAFPRSSTLGSISIDYELGARSFEEGPAWVPSFGVSYTKGDDPLSGKLDQEQTVVGIKLTYKAP
ncbi:MAG: hypothetical protein GC203_03635 [Phenylobacterium sp.]|uniref:hypothetical protein n=1 Tax=Phenylobacterium sp. TaxID=1871053 RepID=UPI0025D7474D|nr:hypothetical protein [Phenylobacterium sp.]MBI1196931.1 hypothetical protein [Phenylobacterium sp.]